MPSRSPCPRACTGKSPGPSSKKASPPWSKSRWPARSPSPSSSWRWPRASGAVLQVGHIERFNPALQALENLAVRPKFVNAERLSTYTFRSTDIGVVFDLMIHDLDLLLSLIAAPVRSVAAVGVSLFGEHEDVANARIEFEDGSVANLTASRASYTPSRKMRIWGAEGYASLDFAAKQATAHSPVRTTQTRPARPRRGRPEPAGRGAGAPLRQDPARRPRPARRLASRLPSSWKTSSSAARGLSRPRVSGEDALRAVRLADQVLRCLEAHRWDAESVAATLPMIDAAIGLARSACLADQEHASQFQDRQRVSDSFAPAHDRRPMSCPSRLVPRRPEPLRPLVRLKCL